MCFCRGLPQVGADRCDDILACPIGNKPFLRKKSARLQSRAPHASAEEETSSSSKEEGVGPPTLWGRLIRELNFHTDCFKLYSRQFDCLLSTVGPHRSVLFVFSEPAALLLDAPRCRHSALSTPW